MPRMTHPDRNDPRNALAAEFSFSGLKTAVVRHMEKRGGAPLDAAGVADLAASFQRVVVDTVLARTFEVAERFGAKSIGIAGGVSANSRLRRDAEARGKSAGVPVYIPRLALSTDNAAMIAAAGLRRLELGDPGPEDFQAAATLDISERLMTRAGIAGTRETLVALAHSAIENWRHHTDERRFTGPAARGDAAVMGQHLEALSDEPALRQVYELLAAEIAGSKLASSGD
jgi:hypothetical protein